MLPSDKPLRLLVIVNLPWDRRFGACQVWMELMEQWRAAGHVVERFTLSEAFPGAPVVRSRFTFQQLRFPGRAAKYVRQNGHRFDVIDALIGTLPFTKAELNFDGLLVARSVGLYHLYERFEREAARRWPTPARGKIAGRVLYRFARRRTVRLSERSVFTADLINVPNQEEATCLREEVRTPQPILVRPYGLTNEKKRALAEATASTAVRLPQQQICFVGMWSPRKGANDWGKIIRRVREEVPGAKFKFLGTMVSQEKIEADLGGAIAGCEFNRDYEPSDLPELLSDCTVGAFPSYVEGFGLAVLEQLGAGLPVVAYDIPGPRDMLREGLDRGLVSVGNVEEFARRVVEILRLSSTEYEALADQARAHAARFSWQEIAAETLQAYRGASQRSERPIVFVQPFSIGGAGGGSRILRSLVEQTVVPWLSVCSLPRRPRPWVKETHFPYRPYWGRVEHSRLARIPVLTTFLFTRGFRARLKRLCQSTSACAIHAVAHAGLDFAESHRVARELSLPFFLTLHDDLAYTALGRAPVEKREAVMREAWLEAAARFVISNALGEEYSRRYGIREFHTVTDGLAHLNAPRQAESTGTLRIYFMGLFHMSYEPNLRALLDGIGELERQHATHGITVTMRCEHVRPQILAGTKNVTILPFSDEAQVQRDMQNADLLYMPLPFGEEHASFARYSLSTKMVTYLGSGVPILYHGPTASAAGELLTKHRAALPLTTLETAEIAAALAGLTSTQRDETAANALALAEREFMLSQQREKFWGTISRVLSQA